MKTFKGNILGKHFVCTDIETTGLDPESPTAGILEVYMEVYDFDEDKILESHHSLHFHPNHADTYFAHRIDPTEFIATKRFESDWDNKMLYKELILKCCDPNLDYVFMSYYVPFEYQWFKKFLDLKDKDLETLRVCDPRHIAKQLYPDRSHSLVPMAADYLGVTPDWGIAFHRATDDTKVMKMVYRRILQDVVPDGEYDTKTYHYILEEHLHDRE